MKRPRRSDKPDTPVKRVHTSEPPAPTPTATDDSKFTRDPDYYVQDGDLVIRVEMTLFRVHRFILSRDSSTFKNMLQGCAGTQGSSDDNPLLLPDDTVEAIRSLLSLLYALPDELNTKIHGFGQETALDDFLTLAEIANRHHFASTERLLVKIFLHHIATLRKTPTVDNLRRALRVAILQNAEYIITQLSRIFARQVLNRSIPADVALEFGNIHSIRSLQGAAHYVFLMDIMAQRDGEAPFEVIKFGQGIDEALKNRLLHGSWSLMRTCLRLRSTAPINQATCEALGIAEWHKTYQCPVDAPSPDLLDLLNRIKQSLYKWCNEYPNRPTALEVHKAWAMKAWSHLNEEIQQVVDNIMDHFDPRC